MKNLKYYCVISMLALCAQSVQAQQEELVRNGDFELNARVERGTQATTAWDAAKPVVVVHVDPISQDNPNYAVIASDIIYNEGFGGISITEGANYDFSVSLRLIPALREEERTTGSKQLIIRLVDESGKSLAEATIQAQGNQWQHYSAQLSACASCEKARLAIEGIGNEKIAIDKVSLKK